MIINFPNYLTINSAKWRRNPIQFDIHKIRLPYNYDPENTFGFYNSEFQPFNQAPFFNDN